MSNPFFNSKSLLQVCYQLMTDGNINQSCLYPVLIIKIDWPESGSTVQGINNNDILISAVIFRTRSHSSRIRLIGVDAHITTQGHPATTPTNTSGMVFTM